MIIMANDIFHDNIFDISAAKSYVLKHLATLIPDKEQ